MELMNRVQYFQLHRPDSKIVTTLLLKYMREELSVDTSDAEINAMYRITNEDYR